MGGEVHFHHHPAQGFRSHTIRAMWIIRDESGKGSNIPGNKTKRDGKMGLNNMWEHGETIYVHEGAEWI